MRLPVSITHDEKQYSGFLTKISGAGNSAMYHLMIDNYYYGRLRFSEFAKSWVFDTNKNTELAHAFAKHVTTIANDSDHRYQL